MTAPYQLYTTAYSAYVRLRTQPSGLWCPVIRWIDSDVWEEPATAIFTTLNTQMIVPHIYRNCLLCPQPKLVPRLGARLI